jgi:hypothetical protein
MSNGQEAQTIPKGATLGDTIPEGATLGDDVKSKPVTDTWYSAGPYSVYNMLTGKAPSLSFKSVLGGAKDAATSAFRGLADPTNAALMMLGGGLKGPLLPKPLLAMPKTGGEGLPAGTDIKLQPTSAAEPTVTAGRPGPSAPQPNPEWFPEPRPETPIDRPGSMWSVGRESLPSRAGRGQPGAIDVLTNIGDRPPLVTPKPTLGVADPDFQALRGRHSLFNLGEEGTPPEINAPSPVSVAGTGTPQGSPITLQGKPLPFSGPPQGPPMNQLRVLSDKLADPNLTSFERNTLLSQFEDLTGRAWRPNR